MKKPFFLLVGLALSIGVIPTMVSVFGYKNIDIGKTAVESSTSADIKNKTKQIINYNTVDKKAPAIKIYNHKKNKVESIDIEKYLYSVVAGEMAASFNDEALKAQAIAARTFVINKKENNKGNDGKHKGALVCTDYTHCQEYLSEKELTEKNGTKWMQESWPKIQKAVNDTKGLIITYNNKTILPLYFSTSFGKTENSEEVFSTKYPYLVSVESPYDKESPKYISVIKITHKDFVDKFKKSYSQIQLNSDNLENQIKVLNYSEGGSVEKIKIGNKEIRGRDVRSILNLNSSNFEFKFNKSYIDVVVRGYGHGVGMSQWGANGMAHEGYVYYDILKHYYQNTNIKDIY